MTKILTDKKKIDDLLSRGVDEIIDRNNLKKKLLSGKKLRVKLGIDPTGPRLHLGRSIPILKLKDFQELGHQIVLIIGDFTGLIGDTSDKTSERPMLDRATVEANMQSYVDQFKLILEIKKVEVRYNSEWLAKLDFLQIAELADLFSVHDFTARENIKLRLEAGKRVSLRELLYPIMQGYDSVAVKADVEIGGTDQRFNLLAGRTIQPVFDQPTQDILMNPLINGLDGQKMSTSLGNTIALLDEPFEQYGKIMSMTDAMIIPYFQLLTRQPLKEINQSEKKLAKGANPRDIKMKLAKEIVSMYHGEKAAVEAEKRFITIFQKGQLPTDIPEVLINKKVAKSTNKTKDPICEDLPELLVETKLVSSKSEARRLIEQNALHIDQALITDWQAQVALRDGMIIQLGKRKVIKLRIK